MSKELKKGDRVSIDKNLTHTSRFGVAREMREIFTGTVKHTYCDEVIVLLDYPDDVDENYRISYSYDPRDLTLILKEDEVPKNENGLPIPTSVKISSKNVTTVEFSDGSTTSVKKSEDDTYDLETAIAYCIAKKLVTNSCIKHLAKTAEKVVDKVDTEFYNKFLKPYGFLNENAYTDVEIETLKNYLKTLNDVRSEMALVAIENNLSKDELFGKLRG